MVTASASLALVAGRRGAVVLGDELGASLGKLVAPPRRHTRELFGFPRVAVGDVGLAEAAGAPHPVSAPGVGPGHAARPVGEAPPVRTRGVHIPAQVVMAYARRGAIPAVDTRDGVRLRGVLPGTGLADGDRLVRVGRAPVRSLREVTGIVTSAMLAGQTQLSGVVQRGDDEIAVSVEIPTGAPPEP